MKKQNFILLVFFCLLLIIVTFELILYFSLSNNQKTIEEIIKKGSDSLYNKTVANDAELIYSSVLKMDSWEQKKKFLTSSYITTEGTLLKINKTKFPKLFSITIGNSSGDKYTLNYDESGVKNYLFYREKSGIKSIISLDELKIGSFISIREIYETTKPNNNTKIDLEIVVID